MTSPNGAHVADVHVDVHPDASKFKRELKQQLESQGPVDVAVGPDASKFRTKLEQDLKGLPAVNVRVVPDVDHFKSELTTKLKASNLPTLTVNVDADTTRARQKITGLGVTASRVTATVRVDANTKAATTKVAALKTALAGLGNVRIDINATVTGLGDVRSMATAVARLRAAAAGGDIDIKADVRVTGIADARSMATALARLRAAAVGGDIDINATATVTGVRDLRQFATAATRARAAATGGAIKIDVDAAVTGAIKDLSRVASAMRQLRAVSLAPIRIDVDVNAAGAIADLATVAAAMRSLNRGLNLISIHVHVSINPPGIVAQLAVLHGFLSRLRGMNVRAGVNVNTGNARAGIQALIAAAIAIAPAIVPAAAAAVAAIGAIGPAAFAAAAGIGVAFLAFKGVGEAVGALGDAQSKAAKTGAQYAQRQQQIASAQDQVRDAYRGVAEAERNLANAQRDALRAQEDITRAREDAKDAIEDLDSAVKNNALSIRQANLDLADAEKELKAVQNLPADNRQRIEAQLRYDQARQALDDLTTRQGRLAEEQKRSAKAGVEGSDQVKAAQERAADAQERVRDAAIALTRAQEQVVASQRNLQSTIQSTSATGGAAMDTLREKMAALSPAGQKFAIFLNGLRDEFKQVKAAAEAGLFPGLQRGIEAFLPVLPQVVTFVSRIATALGNMAEAAGKALASPFWQRFFDYMGQVAAPLMEAFGGIIGGLARGFASLLVAFTPFSIQFTQGLARMMQGFADWAAGLSRSNGFNQFIDYVRQEGPKVLALLGQFVLAFIKLGIALAPLATLVVEGLLKLFTWIANAKPGTIAAVAAALGAITLALVGLGGPITIVVAAFVAIGAAAAQAYQRFEPFRNAVNTFWTTARDVGIVVFNALKLAFQTLVDAFKRGGDDVKNTGFLGAIEQVGLQARRIFDGLKEGITAFVEGFKRGGTEIQQGGFLAYMQNLGMVARQVFEWMRDKGIPAIAAFLDWIGPKAVTAVKVTWATFEVLFTVLNAVFKGITTVIGWAWDTVIKPTFAVIAWTVQNVLGPIFTWWYSNVIKPVWDAVRVAIDIAWAAIQVTWGAIQIGLKVLGELFSYFYTKYIKPVWEAVSLTISTVWNTQIKPIFEAVGSFISQHVAPAFAKGVDGLKNIFATIQEGFRIPIRFVVEDLLNNGLLKAYNEIAKMFGVKPDNVRIDVPGLTAAARQVPPSGGGGGGASVRAMATGGFVSGPGTGTSDSIMARLSNGEYVIPAAIVKQFGVSFFDWLIGKKKAQGRNQQPGDGSEGLAFAKGGLVGWITGAMKSAWNTVSDPIGMVKNKIYEMFGEIPGGKLLRDVAANSSKKLVDGVLGWIAGKIQNIQSNGYLGPISADVASVREWVRAQAGKPYIWASAGPTGYDCSGIVSAAYNLLHGKNPYNHTFSTHYMANYFPKYGQVGPLTAGWSHAGERGGGSVGHTAANIAGLPFESRGSRGVVIGNEARPYTGFARWGTFAKGGLVEIPRLYRDQGGMVPPGLSLVDNRTGRDEWMFNDSQMRDLVGARAGGRGGLEMNIAEFHAHSNQSPNSIAKDLYWELTNR